MVSRAMVAKRKTLRQRIKRFRGQMKRIRWGLRRRKQRWVMVSKFTKRGVGAEVGVETGNFSAILVRIARPKRLHLIDPWEQVPGTREGTGARHRRGGDELHATVCRRFARRIERGAIIVHRCGSADAVSDLEALDWAYIDGDHTYQGVKEDLENYYPLVKPGGTIAGDDYAMLGLSWGDGVREAVDEFVAANDCQMTVSGNQFIITKTS
jgi:hypothetical protein